MKRTTNRHMTKPTGRKPKEIGAFTLKEMRYKDKDEWIVDATWRGADTDSGRGHRTFNNWRHAEEFAEKENKRIELRKEKGAGRYTGNDAMDSYLEVSERRAMAKDKTGITLASLKKSHSLIDNHLRPKFGHMRLDEITTKLISDWIIDQHVIAKVRTVRSRYEELNRVLDHAAEHEPPMMVVNPLKVKKIKRKLLGEIEIRANIPARSDLETLREYINGPRPLKCHRLTWSCCRIVVVLAVSCGLRAGEASALEWDDIDPDTGEIDIKKSRSSTDGLKAPKTKAGRRKIPTSPAVREIINQHAEIYKQLYGKCVGPVLRSNSRNYLSALQISQLFNKTMRACGLVKPDGNGTKFAHHAGRHWAASHWLKSTRDIHLTKTWMGHQNASMTLDVYGHCLDDPEARAKFERMPDWLIPPVQIDSPSAQQSVEMESSRALPMPVPDEDSFDFNSKANGPVEPDCPIDVPSIAEPWVKPLIRLLQQGMPVMEAYREINPTLTNLRSPTNPAPLKLGAMRKRVEQEFKRLKLPPPRTIALRHKDERILKLHSEKHQTSDIAHLVGCSDTAVRRVLHSRHKGNANNPLNKKIKSPFAERAKARAEHKTQLKLL